MKCNEFLENLLHLSREPRFKIISRKKICIYCEIIGFLFLEKLSDGGYFDIS